MRRPVDTRARRKGKDDVHPQQRRHQPARLHRNDAEKVDLFVRPTQCIGDQHSADCTGSSDDRRVPCEYEVRDRTADAAPEIELNEAACSPFLLQTRSKHPQREHVECEVRQPRVHEHVRDERPPGRRETSRIESERRVRGIRPKQRQL